jgi:hypothetical protein
MLKIDVRDAFLEPIRQGAHRQFSDRYWDAPADFTVNCFNWKPGEGPTLYQMEILQSLVEHQRVSVRGPHGLGKTGLSSWAVWWFILTRAARHEDDWKVVTTASAWRQLEKYLWPEVHKWRKRIIWKEIGISPLTDRQAMTLNIRMGNGTAFAVASNNHNLIEGAHADHILYMYDEAKAIDDPTWDAAEGALVNKNAYALSVSTPGEPMGRFWQIQTRKRGYEDWYVRAVTLNEAIDAGRIDADWAAARANQWGEESAIYLNRVKGEFAETGENSLIPYAWVEAAVERWHQWRSDVEEGKPANLMVSQIGLDVAAMGGDKTVMAVRRGEYILSELIELPQLDTEDTGAEVLSHIRKLDAWGADIQMDVVAYGAALYHWLSRPERFGEDQIYPFHVQWQTDWMDKSQQLIFANLYSAAWYYLRELLDPVNETSQYVCIPDDEELIIELCAPQYDHHGPRGSVQVEKKRQVKKRLKRSPDKADSVVMAYWRPIYGGMDAA